MAKNRKQGATKRRNEIEVTPRGLTMRWRELWARVEWGGTTLYIIRGGRRVAKITPMLKPLNDAPPIPPVAA